jgi:NADH:ubiquinone oxidoreductase subunit 4 (subunit M)
MTALAILSLLAAGIFLPLYPLSIAANLLLKRQSPLEGSDPLAGPAFKALAIVLMPLAGVALVALGLSLAGDSAGRLAIGFAVWGGLTSVFYAFRLLSARDGKIWIAQLYSSALALVWVGIVHGVPLLLPAVGLALSLLPLLFLLSYLTRRFGIARVGLYPGLSSRMPVFSALFVAAVLVAVAVPFSPAFFAIADLAFGGAAANELIPLAPISLSWLLWTWAGVNLIAGIVFGMPRDDLAYVDLDRRAAVLHGAGMLLLSLFGIFLVEGVL